MTQNQNQETRNEEGENEQDQSWRTRATLSVSETARLLDISKNKTYEAVQRGAIPSLRIGGRILVPVRRLRALLGEESES